MNCEFLPVGKPLLKSEAMKACPVEALNNLLRVSGFGPGCDLRVGRSVQQKHLLRHVASGCEVRRSHTPDLLITIHMFSSWKWNQGEVRKCWRRTNNKIVEHLLPCISSVWGCVRVFSDSICSTTTGSLGCSSTSLSWLICLWRSSRSRPSSLCLHGWVSPKNLFSLLFISNVPN